MKRILEYFQKIENFVLILSFASMTFCVFAQVINRNFIKASMAWSDEVAAYSMIYMALLGTEAGLRDGTQIAVTALTDKLQGIVKKIVQIVAKAVIIAFSANSLYWGVKMVATQLEAGQRTPVLGIPMAVPYMSLVISFGIIVVVQSVLLIGSLMQIGDHETHGEEEVK